MSPTTPAGCAIGHSIPTPLPNPTPLSEQQVNLNKQLEIELARALEESGNAPNTPFITSRVKILARSITGLNEKAIISKLGALIINERIEKDALIRALEKERSARQVPENTDQALLIEAIDIALKNERPENTQESENNGQDSLILALNVELDKERQKNEELKERLKFSSHIAGTVPHELSNTLQALIGEPMRLKENLLNKDKKISQEYILEALDRIIESGKEVWLKLESIRLLKTIREGRKPPLKPFNLSEFEDFQKSNINNENMEKYGVRFIADEQVYTNIPDLIKGRHFGKKDLLLFGNPTLLLNVAFANILLNGYQATPEGVEQEITVAISKDNKKGLGIFTIRNKGRISDAAFQNMFSYGNTTKLEGTGTGTLLMKAAIESMGGTIAFRQLPEETEVTVKIPLYNPKKHDHLISKFNKKLT